MASTVPGGDAPVVPLLGMDAQPEFPWPAGRSGAVPLALAGPAGQPFDVAVRLLKARVSLMLAKGIQNENQAHALADELMRLDCVEGHRAMMARVMAELKEEMEKGAGPVPPAEGTPP